MPYNKRAMEHKGQRVRARVFFGRDNLWIAFLALACFLAHALAFLFPDARKVLAAVWPAGGVGLAALPLKSPPPMACDPPDLIPGG